MKTTMTFDKGDIVAAVKDSLAAKGMIYKSHKWQFVQATDCRDQPTGETWVELAVDVEWSGGGQR